MILLITQPQISFQFSFSSNFIVLCSENYRMYMEMLRNERAQMDSLMGRKETTKEKAGGNNKAK